MSDHLPVFRTMCLGLLSSLLLLACVPEHRRPTAGPRFDLSLAEGLADSALDGRMLLLLSRDSSAEPRFQISDGPQTGLVYGADVDGLTAEGRVRCDADTFG